MPASLSTSCLSSSSSSYCRTIEQEREIELADTQLNCKGLEALQPRKQQQLLHFMPLPLLHPHQLPTHVHAKLGACVHVYEAAAAVGPVIVLQVWQRHIIAAAAAACLTIFAVALQVSVIQVTE